VVNPAALGRLAAITDKELVERFLKVVTSVADGPVASGERAIGGTAFSGGQRDGGGSCAEG